MTYWLICDRCGAKHDDPNYPAAPDKPGDWTQADGNDLCPTCAHEFITFMKGEEVKACLKI